MSLAQRSFSAARWTLSSNMIRAGLQFAQLAVLTRFLTPQDYGLMALVTVVISYAALFNDLGLSTAYIQKQSISDNERSSLYWLSVSLGIFLMLIVSVLSPLAENLFNAPGLPVLIALVSTNFLVNALGQQLRMDAEKALNFRPVAVIEIAAAAGGFCLAILGAWAGWGVYALVAASMLTAWITLLLSWLILAQGWRPFWRFRWAEVRWFIRFGGGMVLNNIINHFNTTVDVLLGGRLLGAGQLGLYSVPRNLILQIQLMVNPIFTRIGFPVIASIQDDKQRVKDTYLKIMNLTASVNAPVYVALAVLAPDFVELLLGESFHDAAPLLQTLAVWGLLRSFGNPAGSLLFGLGHVRRATLWNLGLVFVIPPSLYWGSLHGAQGMALSMALVMAVLFIPAWQFLIRPTCGASLWSYSKQVLIPTLCAVAAGSLAWLIIQHIEFAWLRLLTGLGVGLASYIALSYFCNRECMALLKSALRQRMS